MELHDLIRTPRRGRPLSLGGNALELVRVTLRELKLSGIFTALEALTSLSAPSQEPVADPTGPVAAATDAW